MLMKGLCLSLVVMVQFNLNFTHACVHVHLMRLLADLIHAQAKLEITVGHWPFSYHLQGFGQTNTIC